MEPQTDSQLPETKEQSPLHQVTPLSKYLAMLLFIVMPFLGGWIGYTYAPEKVVEVEVGCVVEFLNTNETKKFKSDAFDATSSPEKVFVDGDRYAPDGLVLSDIEMYLQTGLPYVTTFSKDYPLYVLGSDNGADTIYRYDDSTKTYQPLEINILEVAKNAGIIETGSITGLLNVVGWSNDLRYIGIQPAVYEGLSENPVYYIDTENLDNGFTIVPNNFLSVGTDQLVSPDRSKILGVNNLASEEESNQIVSYVQSDLLMFDLNTQKVKSIYTHNGQKYTFQSPGFYGPGFPINAKWLDDNTLEIKISTIENFKMLGSSLSEENFKKFNDAQETVVIKID